MPVGTRPRKARVSAATRIRNARRQQLRPDHFWEPGKLKWRIALKAVNSLVNVNYGKNDTLRSVQARLDAWCEVAAEMTDMADDPVQFERAIRHGLKLNGRPKDKATKGEREEWELAVIRDMQIYIFEERIGKQYETQ